MTQSIIDLESDKMPEGLKIMMKTGTVLYDSACIAGVDYDNDQDENCHAPIADDDEEANEEAEEDPVEEEEESDKDSQDPEDDITMNPEDDTTIRSEEPEGPEEGSGSGAPGEGPGPRQEEDNQQGDNTNEDRSRKSRVRTSMPQSISMPPACLNLYQCHLDTQGHAEERHSTETARVKGQCSLGATRLTTIFKL